ncbi:MAG: metallophosphoesterase family protein [Eubacteriales bacterium]|jgi:predicted phosphodiesterase|nr:metallophosphoesterase family protein [Eubacteriales bacterium]MDD3109367.1 metallophosphoesterase family protein [Eubacteriales bacterium]MDD3572675.1 metallophosphoesterase family protein [Eubacteriales bacterium]MDD4134276.1 metallophosphoesterase family protein [Eubacteriales bacterium]NLO14155.1 metallophosphoesterase [Clostridiales bacterium]
MVTLRALVVADEESRYIWDFFDRQAFKGIDVIIACGDLKASYLSFLTTMVAAPLFYVHGNHDGHFLRQPPEGCDNLEERMQVLKGIRFIGFGGALASSPKPFHYSERDAVRQITRRLPEISYHGGFDVLVTHAPVQGLGDLDGAFHRGFKAYRALIDLFGPKYHFHGHVHTSYRQGASRVIRYGDTTIVNAFGYRVLDLQFDKPGRRKRLSYIKTRYDWGRAYGSQP